MLAIDILLDWRAGFFQFYNWPEGYLGVRSKHSSQHLGLSVSPAPTIIQASSYL